MYRVHEPGPDRRTATRAEGRIVLDGPSSERPHGVMRLTPRLSCGARAPQPLRHRPPARRLLQPVVRRTCPAYHLVCMSSYTKIARGTNSPKYATIRE